MSLGWVVVPAADFVVGAGAGLLYDWLNPTTQHYPIPTWLGFGVSFIFLFGFFQLLYWLVEVMTMYDIALCKCGVEKEQD